MSFSVMDDWKVVELSSICDVIDSLHKTPQYSTEGFPMVRVKDLYEGYFNISNPAYVQKEIYEEFSKKYKPKYGDILFSRVGSYGITSFVNTTEKFCLGQNTVGITNFRKQVNNKFVYYYLISPNVKNQIESLVTGSTQKTISMKSIKALKMTIPPLTEQKSIAHIISTLDDKIEVNNQINKTLENMAQAIFKQWFVDFEFPNEDGEPYKSSGGEMVESELGMIPKGWEVGCLSDTSQKIYSGGTPKTNEDSYWNGSLPWMSSGETRNSFLIATEKSITELAVKNSSTKLALRYSTVIASAGQGMTRGQTTLLLIDTFVNQSIIVLQAKNGFEFYNFCNLSLRYDEMRGISDSHSIRGSLTTKMISTMSILIPDENVLISYNNIVKKMFENIENNIFENNSLVNIRDTLLPQLMSGEIRVPLDSEGDAS